jgi:ubiquinone/menaquinone biosynthesis C-methylase UbiE
VARGRKFWIPILSVLLLVGTAAWVQRDWIVAKAYIALLEWDWRVRKLQVERVTGVLAVVPGQKVADLGAGSGVFSRSLAKVIGPEGIVYAVDINPRLLEYVESSSRKQGLSNVKTVLATETDPLLPEPVDLILICNTLHHISSRPEYLQNLRRYLRPSGRLAIIDFIKSPHLFSSSKYSLTELERWLAEAGYQPTGRYSFLQNNFFVLYACPTCPEPIGEL